MDLGVVFSSDAPGNARATCEDLPHKQHSTAQGPIYWNLINKLRNNKLEHSCTQYQPAAIHYKQYATLYWLKTVLRN